MLETNFFRHSVQNIVIFFFVVECELVAVLITGVISTFDFIGNVATLCFTGRCRSDCCRVHLEHDEIDHHPQEI